MVEEEHEDSIYYLANQKPLSELSTPWHEIQNVQEQIRALVGRVLKSNDILYPCRFCRHLLTFRLTLAALMMALPGCWGKLEPTAMEFDKDNSPS